MKSILEEINYTCRNLHRWVYEETKGLLKKGKLVGLVGGEHSVPLGFLQALAERLQKFHELGSRLSDHSFPYFFSHFPSEQEARQLFEQTLEGQNANREEKEQFGAFIMLYLCRWYSSNNWTMQVHLGPLRNNSSHLLKTFGPDAGTDSIGDWTQAEKMSAFLDRLDQDDALPKTIVYNNNPADNFVVSTMLGNFQRDIPGKMQFGSGWWHLDQRDGMEEQIKTLANTGLLSRFIGMLTDSRSFLSFPRHEYFRRILCNLLGNWVRGQRMCVGMKVVRVGHPLPLAPGIDFQP